MVELFHVVILLVCGEVVSLGGAVIVLCVVFVIDVTEVIPHGTVKLVGGWCSTQVSEWILVCWWLWLCAWCYVGAWLGLVGVIGWVWWLGWFAIETDHVPNAQSIEREWLVQCPVAGGVLWWYGVVENKWIVNIESS